MSADLQSVADAVSGRIPGVDSPAAISVLDVTHDSRLVKPGFLYCCVTGGTTDGHVFAEAAKASGAVALLVERRLDVDLPQVVVDDVRYAMGLAAALVHGHPARELTIIGVTGTNGKSSVVQILADIFNPVGRPTAIVGTLQGPRTTPESTDLQRMLRGYVDDGITTVALEVSSHAMALHRVVGVRFACAIFTNLGRDHLDFHHTVEDYFKAKALLFSPAFSDAGVVNADDAYGRRLLEQALIPLVAFGMDQALSLRYEGSTTRFQWRGQPVELHLTGAHNVANALAAANAASVLGVAEQDIISALSSTAPVRGRFEMVDFGQRFLVAIDYAHTPDALDSALIAARQAAGHNRIVLVFGCGGDRDVQKRPEMGQAAEKGADVVIVTSDNPRSESPDKILDDILRGVARPEAVMVEPDRRVAIEQALTLARPGDVVLIAGKGHETYQVIGDETFAFDDREVAARFLEGAR